MAPKRNSIGSIKHQTATIKVVGIGGAGNNAITRMKKDFFKGVDFIAINTDTQDLEFCDADLKIHIGKNLTKGLGTGMNPDLGRQAAEETRAEIIEALKGADLVFITAGLGGGTGTGAAPIVAEAAKELGALTIAVVTKPFTFEGSQRAKVAQEGFIKLKDKVDTLITVPNDRIFAVIQKDTTMVKAFEIVDGILRDAIQGIADLIAMPGIINVDFADVKTIMENAGSALVGIGLESGQERAVAAATQAVNSPLLEISIQGAKGILFGVSGAKDIKMNEINDIAKMIADAADPSAKIIFGAYHDKKMKQGFIKVTIIATGFNGISAITGPTAVMPDLFSAVNERKPELKSRTEEKKEAAEEVRTVKSKQDHSNKKNEDVWDIPTFLRRKKK